MRLACAARFTGVWWLLPLQLVAGYVIVTSTVPASSSYPLAAQVVAAQGLTLIAPLGALAAAWHAARLRPAHYDERPRRRSLLAVRADRLLAPVVSGLIAAGGCYLVAARANDALGFLSPRVAIVVVASLVVTALLGDVLGSRLPALLAAPSAVVLPYLLIGFPPAMNPPWLRHLVTISDTCCFVYQTISPRAVLAAGASYLALGLLLWLVQTWAARGTTTRQRRRTRTLLTAAAATALGISVLSAGGLGYSPAVARAGTPRCVEDGLRVCVWPEHAGALPAIHQTLTQVHAIAAADHVDLPTELREAPADSTRWPVSSLDLDPAAGPATTRLLVLNALVPYLHTSCADSLNSRGLNAQLTIYGDTSSALSAWWRTKLGSPVGPGDLQSKNAAQLYRHLAALPVDHQATFINTAITAMRTCQPLATGA